MLCYFWVDKKTKLPYIGFKGAQVLDFPWLERGDRTMFSIMRIDPYEDLPLKHIRKTVKACIDLQAKASRSQSEADLKVRGSSEKRSQNID
jgi:hypothetical protein